MSFADDLAAVQAAPKPHLDVEVTVNKNLYVLRFVQMDPFEWTVEADKCPARPGVGIDMLYGYNLRALTKSVAPLTGTLVEGESTVPVEDWQGLLKAVGGSGFQEVSQAIWSLNEAMPSQAVVDAKKALTGLGKSSV